MIEKLKDILLFIVGSMNIILGVYLFNKGKYTFDLYLGLFLIINGLTLCLCLFLEELCNIIKNKILK